ncbi:MAG: extracellular solute-binding protein [Kiloniellales bacterium]
MITPGRSLRRSLTLRLLILALAGTAVLFTAALSYSQRAADAAYDQVLAGAALAIAEAVTVVDGAIAVDLPVAAFDMLALAQDDRVFYQVVAPDGSVVTGYGDLPSVGLQDRPGDTHFADRAYRGETVRFVSIGRLLADPELQGWAVVQVGQTRLTRDTLARQMALGSVLPILVVMGLAILLAGLVINTVLRPLRKLEADLLDRDATDLRPLTGTIPAEVVQLVEAFNRFTGRLRQQLDGMRDFIADAAHQMRTPLASLKADIDLAQGHADLSAPQRETYARLTETIDQASGRVNQLLAHAFVAHRSELIVPEPVDLGLLLPDALRDLAPLALRRGMELSFDSALADTRVAADATLLREAVRNLIDNALNHGRPGGRIAVSLTSDPAATADVVIEVADDGPGIPPERRAAVTERFNRPAGNSGSGLGLAIVRRVAQAHGGRLTLDESALGGLAARLSLPRDGRTAGRHHNPPSPTEEGQEQPNSARSMGPATALLFGLLAWVGLPDDAAAFRELFPAPAGGERKLLIHSATDLAQMRPLIRAFQVLHPDITIDYVDMNTNEVFAEMTAAAAAGGPTADLVLSSAMDLQVKLVNDGLAATHATPTGAELPAWARWRNQLFAFTYEPAVIVYNSELVPRAEVPRTRFDLIQTLRRDPERYRGRVTTYDILDSGVGYLLATQDARQSGTFSTLIASLAAVEVELRCCTNQMLHDIARGRYLIGYNLLGSYARDAVAKGANIGVVMPQDVTLALSRTALISAHAANPEEAHLFLDFLISDIGQLVLAERSNMLAVHPAVSGPLGPDGQTGPLRQIQLSPSLLVHLDDHKRRRFLTEWLGLLTPERLPLLE